MYGVYDTNENYNDGQITKNEMIRDQISNSITFIPYFGTGWGLTWELGQKYGPSTWYGKNNYKYFE